VTNRPRHVTRWVSVLALTAVLAAGCGQDTPSEAAPELARQLAQVDRAVTTGDVARIRERVESLVSATEAARDAGRLDDEQADRILSAADALLAQLPEEVPEEAPSPEPSPPASPSPTITPSPEEEEGDEGEGHEEKPKHEERNPKPEKPKPEKQDKGGKKH
jgi:outer membrane biosynthesis protein TonB